MVYWICSKFIWSFTVIGYVSFTKTKFKYAIPSMSHALLLIQLHLFISFGNGFTRLEFWIGHNTHFQPFQCPQYCTTITLLTRVAHSIIPRQNNRKVSCTNVIVRVENFVLVGVNWQFVQTVLCPTSLTIRTCMGAYYHVPFTLVMHWSLGRC